MTIAMSLPIVTVSEANKRDHWSESRGRTKYQRRIAAFVLRKPIVDAGLLGTAARLSVTLTRLGPLTLDGDNLQRALKAVRDGIADALGTDDGDPRVSWWYAQEKGKPHQYAVRVEIREEGKLTESTASGEHARCDEGGIVVSMPHRVSAAKRAGGT